MRLHFYKQTDRDFIDKFLDVLPVFFPSLQEIRLVGDDGVHSLPIHSEELFGKTSLFIQTTFIQNQTLELQMVENNKAREVFLNKEEHFHYLDSVDFGIEECFKHLYPIYIHDGEAHYYSPECGHTGEFIQTEKIDLTESILSDYFIAEKQRLYKHFFTFTKTGKQIFTYSYKSFLPENITQENFIRLVLYSFSFQQNISTLKKLKHSIPLVLDLTKLKLEKTILFSCKELGLNGILNPIKKELTVILQTA